MGAGCYIASTYTTHTNECILVVKMHWNETWQMNMWWLVCLIGECPTGGRFSTGYASKMATYSSLD
jgi:hypothetical protein